MENRMGSFPQIFVFFEDEKVQAACTQIQKCIFCEAMTSSFPITLTNIYWSMNIHIKIRLLNRFLNSSCRICHRPENSSMLACLCVQTYFLSTSIHNCPGRVFKRRPSLIVTSESCPMSTSVVTVVAVTRPFLLRRLLATFKKKKKEICWW